MKKRKFADGGAIGDPNSPGITVPGPSNTSPTSSNGTAFGGLKDIMGGAQQVSGALQNTLSSLGGSGGGNVTTSPPSYSQGSAGAALNQLGVTRMKSGGMVSASNRADGVAQRGKTRGRMV